MLRKILTFLSFLAVISVSAVQADQKKIGFIYIGPPGDHGWTYMHDQGRIYMENALGDSISTTYIENVPENADAVRAIRKLAASGHDLIFTTSFNYMDQTLEVAKEFPDVKFEHATGFKREWIMFQHILQDFTRVEPLLDILLVKWLRLILLDI